MAMEHHLIELGATMGHRYLEIYTYFNQPEGVILKLTTIGQQTFCIELKQVDGRWQVLSYKLLVADGEVERDLRARWTVKRKLSNLRRLFWLDNQQVSTNIIEGVGTFLIVESDNPKLEWATNRLGISPLRIVNESFDKL